MRSQQQYGVLTVGIAVACTVQYSTVSPLGIKRRRSACVMGTHGSDVTSICPDFRRGAPPPCVPRNDDDKDAAPTVQYSSVHTMVPSHRRCVSITIRDVICGVLPNIHCLRGLADAMRQ
jgi:hypothetical protein